MRQPLAAYASAPVATAQRRDTARTERAAPRTGAPRSGLGHRLDQVHVLPSPAATPAIARAITIDEFVTEVGVRAPGAEQSGGHVQIEEFQSAVLDAVQGERERLSPSPAGTPATSGGHVEINDFETEFTPEPEGSAVQTQDQPAVPTQQLEDEILAEGNPYD